MQTADFRNLAHGRHAWLHHRAAGTFMLALTGVDSREVWAAIDAALPADVRRLAHDHGSCGRLDNLLGLIDGFGIVEALGEVLGIDPGKPGIGDFGRAVYDDASLATVASALPPRVRHKRAAVARSDAFDADADPLHAIGRARLEALAEARIGGAVFDYDGPPLPPSISSAVRSVGPRSRRVHRRRVAGLVRGWEAQKATGVRMIAGARVRLDDGRMLLLYPTDKSAWSRLTRLLTVGKSRAGKGGCALAWEDVVEWNEGLIAILIPDLPGDLTRSELGDLRDTFGDRGYCALALPPTPRTSTLGVSVPLPTRVS